MLGSFLGRKFSTKCKQSMKSMKARIALIRNRKGAMLKILKKDVADLLAEGHHANALGRMDALILEMNRLSCYDMIDNFCEHIISQLSFLEKQRDCPEDEREAVATLIFAAARFSDLPELAGLRRTFIDRYGTTMEAPVNQQFVDKTGTRSFSKDKKLSVMQEISQEFNVPWNANSFNQKKLNPSFKPELPRQPRPDAALNEQNGTNTGFRPDAPLKQEIFRLDVKHCVSKGVRMISNSNKGRDQELRLPPVRDRHRGELEINQHGDKPGLAFFGTATKQEDREDRAAAMDLIPHVKPKVHKDDGVGREKPSKNLITPPYVKSISNKNRGIDSNRIEPRRRFAAAVESVQGLALKEDLGSTTSDGKLKPRSVRRTHSKLRNANEGSNKTDTGNFKIPSEKKHGDGGTKKKLIYGIVEDNYDGEETDMDKLLRHYSRKGMGHRKSKSWAQEESFDDGQNNDSNVPEAVKRSATTTRVASMGPDSPLGGGRVHPRLPDYDEIAARFNALKRS